MIKKDSIISRLKKVVWHDLPIDRIELSTKKSTKLSIEVCLFNEQRQEYDKLKLSFLNIKELKIDKLILTNKSDIELSGFNFSKKDNYDCKLSFLSGFSETNFEISLKCDEIQLI